MRTGAIWGLSLGLLAGASSVHAAPPEPEKAPFTGVGRIVGGSLALAAGTMLFGYSAGGIWQTTHALSRGDGGSDPATSIDSEDQVNDYSGLALYIQVPGLLVGSSMIAAGGVLLGIGIAEHRRYRGWEYKQADRPVPPRGDGMLGSGVVLMCTGATAGALTVGLTVGQLQYPSVATAFATSVAVTLGGVGLVVGSRFHRRKHMRWQNARMAPSLSPLPGARPGIGGLSFGVVGRF